MNKGKLEVITGCMFSGKTEELIRRVRRLEHAKKYAIVFKPDIDNRYDNTSVVSHPGDKTHAFIIKTNIKERPHGIGATKLHTVFIDEIQFFKPEILHIINDFIKDGINVIVSGLDKDYMGNSFGIMPELLALADEVLKLKAVCVICGEDATMTYKRNWEFGASIIEIGADDKYEARCKNCYSELPKE